MLWILAGLLAALFLLAGGTKLAQPKEKLAASPNVAWTDDFSPGLIGALNVVLIVLAVVVAWSRFGPYSFS